MRIERSYSSSSEIWTWVLFLKNFAPIHIMRQSVSSFCRIYMWYLHDLVYHFSCASWSKRRLVFFVDKYFTSVRKEHWTELNSLSLVWTDVISPEGLSVDWINRFLYWTDSGKKEIAVVNLDTKQRTTLISSGLVNPRGIAVHPFRQ